MSCLPTARESKPAATELSTPPDPFRTFKSELDWSPKSWFQKRADKKWTKQDEDALISHLQEYLDIEKKAKQNGTWLKNKDGSTFDGDPRSWV